MAETSKPISASQDAQDLAEAYALLRQVKHYLALPAPRPRATEDVREAVNAFCLAFELKHHPRRTVPTETATPEF